jgi:hypothetical protein
MGEFADSAVARAWNVCYDAIELSETSNFVHCSPQRRCLVCSSFPRHHGFVKLANLLSLATHDTLVQVFGSAIHYQEVWGQCPLIPCFEYLYPLGVCIIGYHHS